MQLDNTSERASFRKKSPHWILSQIVARGITDQDVLFALSNVPREEFIPEYLKKYAYEDGPLPIGYQQTISQPYIVAYMTALAEVHKDQKVLEVGTGSGYQAAILSELVAEVYSIELVEPLAQQATEDLSRLGYVNVQVKAGDGYYGWPEKAPFDVIMLTAAISEIPEPLLDQLKPGGRLVAPIGSHEQSIVRLTKSLSGELKKQVFIPVKFVPMLGKAHKASKENHSIYL